ncbi:MAG: Flp pilus assembly complex ATPase component TadA [Phycisphaerae bacterium]|nr:Flp pilus assembly complex ATPase component TadA [Phycisphaerae bacterium]
MPELKLTPIRGQAKGLSLTSGKITIGRGGENTIPLIDERASRVHCAVEPDGTGRWLVRDLNSRNGTKVNDQRIESQAIKPGDVIKVGNHEFLVESVGGASDKVNMFLDAAQLEAKKIAAAAGTGELSWMFEIGELTDNIPPRGTVEAVSIIDANGVPSDVLIGTTDGPNCARMLLQLASKARATDIHVEPKGEKFNIRMRVDGDMVAITELPKRIGELLNGVVKAACHMHVAGRDAVQEGHFSVVFPDRRVEYRISFTPSMYGQKLVIRVLDQRGAPGALAELGMANYMLDRIRQVCDQDSGLILACGPTGSGKTTTLYNAIRGIDRQTRNVITIEDPVEYQLDNVTQIPIDEHKGNTFGTLLRSVLRQDPDVILVGEIRDEETARTAMQAALTGHLVFSSVHAKESITAVFRLLDLKVEPYLVANSLNLVLAQRLVRILCEHCKRPAPVSPGTATRLGRFLQGKTQTYTATGCLRCLRTGYRGRRALFELLDFNDELRDIVLNNPSITGMKKVIEQGLFTTLQQFGWRLVAEGVTTLDEVDRVAGVG